MLRVMMMVNYYEMIQPFLCHCYHGYFYIGQLLVAGEFPL